MNVIDISVPPSIADRAIFRPGRPIPVPVMWMMRIPDTRFRHSSAFSKDHRARWLSRPSTTSEGPVFDTIGGLPVHALVVHAVVVLLPLACLGLIAVAVWAPWRARFGVLVVLAALAATGAVFVAKESGERLAARVGEPADHAALGSNLLWYALPLLVVAVVLVGVHWRAARSGVEVAKGLAVVLALLAVVAAGVNLYEVYRVGDSGARAVWGQLPPPQ
jgi:hypothetical protein